MVACSIDDAEAGRVAIRSTALCGAQPIAMIGPLSQRDEVVRSCSALVWDLAPWDQDAAGFLKLLVRERPDLPVLALLPDSEDGVRFVAICRSHPGLRVDVFDPRQPRYGQIESAVRGLVCSLPTFVVAREIGRLQGKQWLARVMCSAMAQAAHGLRPSVAECVRASGSSPRTLERQLRAAELPTPKELVDWATVLHLKHAEATTGHTPSELSRAMGLTANDTYRIRSRLAERMGVDLREIRDADFRQVMQHFTTRCGLSRNAA